jgi:Uma2 family endonuclease
MVDEESKRTLLDESALPAGQPPENRSKELALTLANTLNVAGLLAAPRVLAKVFRRGKKKPARQELLNVLEDAVKAFGSSAGSAELATALCELRGRIAMWEPRSPAPKPIVEAARGVFRALEIPEPDEGWDRWEGEPEEPERPPPPMPRVLRSEPMSVDEWLAYDGPGELVDEILVEEKARTPLQDAAAAWLLATLRAWALPRGGVVFGRGHKLIVATATGRKPDVCVYIPKEKTGKGGALTTPTLVLEVLSANPVDERRARVTSLKAYGELGVSWYWILDASVRSFEILKLTSENRYTIFLSAIHGQLPEIGLEGLAIDLDALWDAVASTKT